jgi:hypothetical protein
MNAKYNENTIRMEVENVARLQKKYIEAKEKYLDSLNNPDTEKDDLEYDKDMMEGAKKILGFHLVDLWMDEVISIHFNQKEDIK